MNLNEKVEREVLAMIRAAHPMAVGAESIARILNEHEGRVVNVLNEMAAKRLVENNTNTEGRVLWREAHLP